MLGVDNTAGITDVAAMKAAGYTAIFRYLSNTPSKNLIMSQAPYDTELRRYLDNGVAVVMNWESSGHIDDNQTNHPGDAHAQGVEDATRANDQARKMGHSEAPIYFSIDFDCSDWAGLTAYFQAVASVIGLARTGVYGGYWVVDHLVNNGLVTYVWQTLAWSTVNGVAYSRHPRANVIQRVGEVTVAGVACDVDEILTPADFGQLPRGAAPAPTPAPVTLPEIVDGSTSALVWNLQLFMNRAFASYSHIDAGPGPTSRCGPQTEAAVTEFQRRMGISTAPPFAVGPKTWAALESFGFQP
ncbi:DUF1906 domain-containing protein [Actinomycetospora endophytica]|uniref:DUF1906 domain-containing protein n=1 Tax=Actinomycetospora endophytica TaxID=2291215 RepID=A0ABS8P5K7_9PSEU|nr:glycoside hydrolase domain-containing protein [Actinomycetospora endophytica]MCD2193542.1 DUF1906 domain-containing protein [Actinomycetospora endophytica]